MTYTVKELAELSGITVRTLHWYDKVGLLKPAYYGSNNYRYYEEEQVLILQQVLFFKDLGFSLDDIQKMLENEGFNRLKALESQQRVLENRLEHTKCVLETLSKTISHVKGTIKMDGKDFYKGLKPKEENAQKATLIEFGQGGVAEKIYIESLKKDLATEDKEALGKQSAELFLKLCDLLEEGLKPDSKKAQKLIAQHYELSKKAMHASKDVYLSQAQLYVEHPDFRKYFDDIQLELAVFVAEAMRVYCYTKLS